MMMIMMIANKLLNVFVLIVAAFITIDGQIQIKSNFSCQGRPSGYYADIDTGCQIYHMCDGLGRQFSYSCPNTTLFQQRMLICDHWYMVNCSKSEIDYSANLLIGQREKPFVEDSEKHPYHRTPRPDLLSHPSAPEYDIIYRTGRARYGSNLNLVGVDSDASTTGKTAYSLPSHWSTKYYADATTPLPLTLQQQIVKTTKPPLNLVTKSNDNKKMNVFDKTKSNKNNNEHVQVNFPSSYTATTPVYPLTVAVTPPSIADDQLLPFNENDRIVKEGGRNVMDIVKAPSKYYEPPKLTTSYRNKEEVSQTTASTTSKPKNINLQNIEWKELRRMFLIPDYEFPLDQVSRPSYGDGPSSFQVNPFAIESKTK